MMDRKKRSHGCVCVCGFEERIHVNNKQNERETYNNFPRTFCVYVFDISYHN